MLQEFRDVFPNEILGLPPKRDIDFTMDARSSASVQVTLHDEYTGDSRIEDATARVVGE